jgi:predicted dehydrogenase
MASPIGWGLIGAGTVANYGHLPAITSSPDVELLLVADISQPNLARACDKFGVAGVADYRQLLAREDIQAVSICTPAETHREIAEAALAAGKAVLCEKPLAATVADARAVAEAASRAGAIFAVDFHLRLTQRSQAIKAALRRGDIGEVAVMRFVMNWACHGVEGEAGARRARFMEAGGPMLDNGVHFFDLAAWYSEAQVAGVVAEGQWVEPQFEFPGHVVALARMSSGALAMVEMSFVYGHTTPTLPATGAHQILGTDGVITDTEIHTRRGAEPLPEVKEAKRFDRVYAEVARCFRAGTMADSPLATAEDGARATEASIAAVEDALRRRPQPR